MGDRSQPGNATQTFPLLSTALPQGSEPLVTGYSIVFGATLFAGSLALACWGWLTKAAENTILATRMANVVILQKTVLRNFIVQISLLMTRLQSETTNHDPVYPIISSPP